ncbi:sulfite oxidase-like oxidoreductase [Salinadaptatus halalkaliphilus]|uniref:Sulfite oxidase-like oxidoreductase n=1 Tax=Salinadaptatus halalkaliphilus TaxID=2419781 RepID=A0A4S3TLF9_9EURY|nr:sulfite oxidase-like oxidoreductase [Salinadaptatus halalkaliphilus]THE64999.1 sulfite oxidase-like oxidoreductase [Salinadaptatus halalkaliphilus]
MSETDVTDLYEEFGDDRVPPGQRETSAFPVLSKGETPAFDPGSWEFTVTGAVETELSFSWDEFRDLPSVTQRQDFHCVTGWSKLDCRFTGVSFLELAERAGVIEAGDEGRTTGRETPSGRAVHVLFSALDGYTTDLPLEDCLREEVLFAWGYDGEELPSDHGGPLRVVTPHKYAYKGAKWVDGIEFCTAPTLGYWERRGYSETANPWAEERYS